MPARIGERVQRSKLLRPAPGIWELHRPGLIERLDEGRAAPLSIICGMAGSGKTTLARQWIREMDGSSWIALDRGDDNLNRFVHLLVAAIRAVSPGFGALTLSDLAIGSMLTPDDLAATFCDEIIETDRALTVVLDDFHHIVNQSILEFLDWIVHLPPPNLHLCFVSRTDPPLSLSRFRAHYHLTEIRLAQLLLTLEETRQFLIEIAQTAVTPAAVTQLYEQTEGWITGLHLNALAIRDTDLGSSIGILRQRASEASIAFLADEIVAHEPEDVQRQLLLLAIPERINPELSWYLLNAGDREVDSAELLRNLEANGFFLTSLGDDHNWYRFHPLFRETVLETSERRFGSNELQRAHRRASEWFSANQFIGQALRHSLAAGDIERAADLVEAHAQYALATDNWLAVEWWLSELPLEIRDRRIELVLVQTWIDQMRGSYRKLAIGLEQTRELLHEHRDSMTDSDRAAIEAELGQLEGFGIPVDTAPEQLLVLGTRGWTLLRPRNRACTYAALYFIASAHAGSGNWDAAFAFLEQVTQEDSAHRDDFELVRDIWARTLLALFKFWHGDLIAALDVAQPALTLAAANGLPRLAAQTHYVLGSVHYERNELQEALAHLSACFNEPLTGILFRSESSHQLARAATLLGQHELADATLDRIVDILLSVDFLGRSEWMRGIRAELSSARGQWSEAAAWAIPAPFGAIGASIANCTVPSLIRARTLIAVESSDPQSLALAGQELDLLAERLDRKHIHRIWIGVRTLQAALHDCAGAEDAALAILSDTIDQASGHIRSFLDCGPPFERLFDKLIARETPLGHRRILLEALELQRTQAGAALRKPPARPASHLVSLNGSTAVRSLSGREREILDHLADRRTNKEIADALGISPLTVKRHTINIYAKLGVRSRRQAVRVSYSNERIQPPDEMRHE